MHGCSNLAAYIRVIKCYVSAGRIDMKKMSCWNINVYKMTGCETPGGGVLPYKRLMGMCHWVGSPFHDRIDYNGVAFSIELLEWGRTFSDFWG